jgi:hypothetical protein
MTCWGARSRRWRTAAWRPVVTRSSGTVSAIGNAAAGVYFVRMTFTGENAAREERQRTVFLVK